jgi:hypothetical protein
MLEYKFIVIKKYILLRVHCSCIYLSTVYVCEQTGILGDINNVQSQVMEYLDNCRDQKYTGIPDKTITLIKS